MQKYQSKQLNQYQQNNIEILDSQTLQKLKNNDWRNAPTLILRCIKCGKNGRITMPIVCFFNYDPTRIMCYDCQKLYGKRKYLS